jgi:CheY-like chemotaxis protein
VHKIVVVDDDEDMRETFRDFLQHHGQLVHSACDGTAGLALILAEKPDLAFIDIGLPGLNGYEVARQVRAVLGRSIWLIAVTGYGGESHRREALAAGFDTHLPKPVDTAAVERMLQGGRRPKALVIGHA